MQRLDELEQRLLRVLQSQSAAAGQRLANIGQRLNTAIQFALERSQRRLALTARTLHAVSPLAVLGRGYALVTDPRSGALLLNANNVAPGDAVRARLAAGSLTATVTSVDPAEPSR